MTTSIIVITLKRVGSPRTKHGLGTAASSTFLTFKEIICTSALERILAVKCLVILGLTKRKVSGGNLPSL